MKPETLIRLLLAIFMLCFIVFYQIPAVRKQEDDLEKMQRYYEAQKTRWKRDSIRKAHEIEVLDSALHRIKNRNKH